MLPLIKRYCWVALLVASLPAARGFALLGPPAAHGDAWEKTVIGYDSLITPKNIGEEYRRNTPVMYYDFDVNFSGYFGANGEQAVVNAFSIMNVLTNGVDNTNVFSPGLYEVPMEAQHMNYQALALGLTDLKSETLSLLPAQLGLAQPERFTWTLHDRYLPPGGKCPLDEYYLVVQRNFDPVASLYAPVNSPSNSSPSQILYSSYVNDTLYTYQIFEICTGTDPLASAIPTAVDPTADTYTAVAGLGDGLGSAVAQNIPYYGFSLLNWPSFEVGGFYTGLTRDDIAGLRYLYSTNNVNWESPANGALWYSITTNTAGGNLQLFPNDLFQTGTNTLGNSNIVGNANVFVTLTNVTGINAFNYFYYYDGTYGYGNYAALVAQAQTLAPAALQALYPGLVIASSSNYFVLSSNGIVTSYFTNYPGSPYTSPPILVTVTNYAPTILELYNTTFANVFTNRIWSTNSYSYLYTTTVGPIPRAPAGSPYQTNTYLTGIITNYGMPSGDFLLLPQFYNTNDCPLGFTSANPFFTQVQATTNLYGVPTTNGNTVSSVSLVTYFTNYIYQVNPVTCAAVTNATAWYQGIGQIQFVRTPDSAIADPLTDTYSVPITNYYTMVRWNNTNNSFETRQFGRVLISPDFLISAQDMASPNVAGEIGVAHWLWNVNPFNQGNVLPNLAGPGTINTLSTGNGTPTITFNKVGNVYGNGPLALYNSQSYLSEYTQSSMAAGGTAAGGVSGLLAYGSFDGTTNAPEIYPNGTSLLNIENQLIISVTPSPATALTGTRGTFQTTTFTATGGVAPYTWSLQSGSQLPTGLSLSSGGILSGTPAVGLAAGTYYFNIQLTDTANRVVYFDYSMTLN